MAFAFSLFRQIRRLIRDLSAANVDQTREDLSELAELYGDDARLFILRSLFDQIDFKKSGDESSAAGASATSSRTSSPSREASSSSSSKKKRSKKEREREREREKAAAAAAAAAASAAASSVSPEEALATATRRRFLVDVLSSIFKQQPKIYASLVVRALESISFTDGDLSRLIRALDMPVAQQLLIALGLAQSSDTQARLEGVRFLTHADTARLLDAKVTSSSHLSELIVRQLLFFIKTTSGGSGSNGERLPSDVRDAYLGSIGKLYPDVEPPSAPEPLLLHTNSKLFNSLVNATSSSGSGHSSKRSSSMRGSASMSPAEIMLDAGYACTSSVKTFKDTVLSPHSSSGGKGGRGGGGHSHDKLTEADVAQCIGTMIQTASGLPSEDAPSSSSGSSNTILGLIREHSAQAQAAKNKDDKKDGGGTDGDKGGGWNADVFIQAVREHAPDLSWRHVCFNLDYATFSVPDKAALALLTKLNTLMPSSSSWKVPSIAEMLFREWKHPVGQFSFIKAALTYSHFCASSPRVQKPFDALSFPPHSNWRNWASLDLLETLLHLASSSAPMFPVVRRLLRAPLETCPELLVCGLAQVNPEGSHLKDEFMSLLMPRFLARHPSSPKVFERLWRHSLKLHSSRQHSSAGGGDSSQPPPPSLLVSWIIKSYLDDNDRSFLLRIVQLAKENAPLPLDPLAVANAPRSSQAAHSPLIAHNPVLSALFRSNLPALLIDLAALLAKLSSSSASESSPASQGDSSSSSSSSAVPKRNSSSSPSPKGTSKDAEKGEADPEAFSFERWFRLKIEERGGGFVEPSLQILRENLDRIRTNRENPKYDPRTIFSSEVVASMFSVLNAAADAQAVNAGDRAPSPSVFMFDQVAKAHLADLQASYKEENEPDEIEDLANLYFKQLYDGKLSVAEMVNTLKRFKSSTKSHERDVFQCMVHNLFDEFRFFPKYPDSELQTTGVLFGLMIRHKLVEKLSLAMALRQVLESLRSSPQSKLFRFGTWALREFANVMHEWPKYSAQVVRIEHLRKAIPDYVAFIERSVAAGGVAVSAAGGANGGRSPMLSPSPQLTSAAAAASAASMVDSSAVGNLGGLLGSLNDGGDVFTVGVGGGSSLGEGVLPMSPATGGGSLGSTATKVQSEGSGGSASGGSSGNDGKLPLSSPTTTASGATSASDGSKSKKSSKSNKSKNDPQKPETKVRKMTAAEETKAKVAAALNASDNTYSLLPPSSTGGLSSGGGSRPTSDSGSPALKANATHGFGLGGAPTLNVDSLMSGDGVDGEGQAPDEETKGKISSLINSVSPTNYVLKARDLRRFLKEEHHKYFAQYLVVKRVCVEANFQQSYIDMVEEFASRSLMKNVLKSTYDSIKWLLKTDTILRSSSERSLLKNLGSFLGKLTIGKQKPLIAKELELKKLILDAFHEKRLIVVIPFVAKILECCAKSKIFSPPNPWLMGLISLLKEIYMVSGLKLTLKFEIEMLFMKSFEVDIDTVKASNLLKPASEQQAPAAPQAGGPALEGAADVPHRPHVQGDPSSSQQQQQPGGGSSSTGAAGVPLPLGGLGTGGNAPDVRVASHFAGHINVVVPPDLDLFRDHPSAKRVVLHAIKRAIREIIAPVVERSAHIAGITTRELVRKDFAFEPDEDKMLRAAHNMVKTLTSSLSLVTCKEPLRISMMNHLRKSFEPLTFETHPTLIEEAIQQIASDNLPFGCAYIEHAAQERAMKEIEESLRDAIVQRRNHRASGLHFSGDPQYAGKGNFLSSLPPELRPRRDGLTDQQNRVYDGYVQILRHHSKSMVENRVPAVLPSGELAERKSNDIDAAAAQQGRGGGGFGGTVARQLQVLMRLVDAIPNHEHARLRHASKNQSIQSVLQSFPEAVRAEHERLGDAPLISFANMVFQQMHAHGTSLLHIDLFLHVLQEVKKNSPKVVKELTKWVIYAEDEKKLHTEITVGLVVYKLINIAELDAHLARAMISPTSGQLHLPTVLFALQMISHVVFESRYFHSREFPQIIECFSRIHYSHPGDDIHNPKVIASIRKLFPVRQQQQQPGAAAAADVLPPLARGVSGQPPSAAGQQPPPVLAPQQGAAAGGQQPQDALQQPPVEGRSPSTGIPDGVSTPGAEGRMPSPSTTDRQHAPPQQQQQPGGGGDNAQQQPPQEGQQPSQQPIPGRDRVAKYFEEWKSLSTVSSTHMREKADQQRFTEQRFIVVLERLDLAKPERMTPFFTDLIEIAFANHEKIAAEAEQNGDLDDSAHLMPGPMYIAGKGADGKPDSRLATEYVDIDALSLLIASVVKHFSPPNSERLHFFQHMLGVLVDFTVRLHDSRGADFRQRPVFRLYVNLLQEVCGPAVFSEFVNAAVLMEFAEAFHALRPNRLPSFTFAWVELISHRTFMPKLLSVKGKNLVKCRTLLRDLLVDLFRFMEPFLRNAQLTDSIRTLYRGTLRVLLVLLHDFPKFLCEFHFSFCDVIPPSCIQMRNLILSAFPRTMKLPDPFQANLKVDLLPEIKLPPLNLSNVAAVLDRTNALPQEHPSSGIKDDLDEYLRSFSHDDPSGMFKRIHRKLLNHSRRNVGDGINGEAHHHVSLPGQDFQHEYDRPDTSHCAYNVPLINSLVMYLGQDAIRKMSPTQMSDKAASGAGANQSASAANGANDANAEGVANADGSSGAAGGGEEKADLQNAADSDGEAHRRHQGELTKASIRVFLHLVSELNEEGRYYLLNAIANQLRYPNNHTHFFSWVLLVLFNDVSDEVIQEQITRVLLERLIVQRPHPWGLLITFIELIKNPRYEFWSYNFTRCAPEIERLFKSVASSCITAPGAKDKQQQLGGASPAPPRGANGQQQQQQQAMAPTHQQQQQPGGGRPLGPMQQQGQQQQHQQQQPLPPHMQQQQQVPHQQMR